MLTVNWYMPLEVFEIEEVIFPENLGINPKLHTQENWELYATKVREIMSKVSGIPLHPLRYRD